MAIENLDPEENIQQEVKTQTPALIPFENGFTKSNIWLAGMLKLRSTSIDESMTLYGFIGDMDKLNIDEFEVKGMKIRFADENGSFFRSDNYKIYPKVLTDLKQNYFSDLFTLMDEIPLTAWIKEGGSVYSKVTKNGSRNKANYYFFESNIHPEPSVASDDIFLVCKYMKDGKTEYAIFAAHEVILCN